MASVNTREMLAAAAEACDEKKAEDIRILALDPTESGLTDFFLICTGTNDRQTVAITDEIELRLKRDFATYPNAVEGRRQGEWILMDYVDFIVHVFLPEKRAYYGLERLRPSASTLSVADLNAEIKAAITAKRPRKTAAKPSLVESVAASDEGSEDAQDAQDESAAPAGRLRKTSGVKSPAKRALAALKRTAKKAESQAIAKSRPTKRVTMARKTSPGNSSAASKGTKSTNSTKKRSL